VGTATSFSVCCVVGRLRRDRANIELLLGGCDGRLGKSGSRGYDRLLLGDQGLLCCRGSRLGSGLGGLDGGRCWSWGSSLWGSFLGGCRLGSLLDIVFGVVLVFFYSYSLVEGFELVVQVVSGRLSGLQRRGGLEYAGA